jgi:hypothetical protein
MTKVEEPDVGLTGSSKSASNMGRLIMKQYQGKKKIPLI